MRRHPRVRPEKRGPLMVLGDGLLLFLTLAGTLFSFTTAYHIGTDVPAMLLWCGVVAAVFLTVFSLPRRRWVPLLLLGAGYAFGLWWLWDGLWLGGVSVYCSFINSLADVVSSIGHIYPLAQLTDGMWQSVTALWLMAATAALGLLAGWGVVRARRLLPVFCVTFPPLVPILMVTRAPDWLPLMVLAACWCTLLLTGLCARQDPAGSARLTLLALPTSALLLALLTAVLPQEGYRQPQWAGEARGALLDQLARFNLEGGLLDGPGLSVSGSTGTVNLAAAGPRRFNNRMALRVEQAAPGTLYLRGHSAAVYDGQSWQPLDEKLYDDLAGMEVSPFNFASHLENGRSWNEPVSIQEFNANGGTAEDTVHTFQIWNAGAPGGCIYFPYQLVTEPEGLAGGSFVHDAYLARDMGVWRHTLRYRTDAQPGSLRTLDQSAALSELTYRAFAYEHYLDVPEGFVAGLDPVWRDLVQLGRYRGQTMDPVGLAEVVARTLDHETVYDAETPYTPEGEDFVRYFLDESHRGYCMHYASAGTLLFRAMGVPARYVSGFVTNVPASGRVQVPDSAAHAWVEIYLDGYGWYPVDVTPGYRSGELIPGGDVTLDMEVEPPAPTPTPTPAQESASPSAAPTPSPAPQGGTGQTEDGAGWGWLWVPLGVLGLAALLCLHLWWAGRRERRYAASDDANRAALYFYGRLRALAPWGGREDGRLRELAEKARFSQHILTPSERDEAARLYRREAARVESALPKWKRWVFRYVRGRH